MKEIEFVLTYNNCHIVDSYLITDRKEMEEFCQNYLPERFFRTRTLKSYIREWCAHNLLYRMKFQISRTKDCDLNLDEKWFMRLGYFLLSIFYK
mgnify:CR=1 FL=1